MKFNEKLIELRKKEGLSQEELGYKLNVTRQTVSKWELGQTTPEMDKLKEISRLFNISVDQLINETQISSNDNIANENIVIEDQQIQGKETSGSKNKVIMIILIGILILVVVLIISRIFTGFSAFNKAKDDIEGTSSSFFDKFFGVFNKALDTQGDIINKIDNTQSDAIFNKVENAFNDAQNEMNIQKFNAALEMYSGTKMGASVITAVDKIITSNKTNDRKVTVKYNEVETQDEEEIRNIKREIDKFEDYELYYDYDEDGFICKATIEKF